MGRPRKSVRIAGQRPNVAWTLNPGREKRSIEEAVRIARKQGVRIPRDVEFFEADPGDLQGTLQDLLDGDEMETASGPSVTEDPDGTLSWAFHYNRFGRIPIRIHPDILTSDEAIVAVLTHELYEIQQLRRVFRNSPDGRMNASDYRLQVAPGRLGNFHDRAWDAADAVVLRMRKDRP
jgi:hypothetical protein